MPIRPFLADQAFEPVSGPGKGDALRLRMIDDVATRLVAEKIIALAQRGIRDADTLASIVLEDLRQG